MKLEFTKSLLLSSPDETARLAMRMAPLFVPGDTVLLGGDIGAGKTHFARSVIQARLATAGRFEDVPSPTFTLVQTYDDGVCEIWHADLYRICDESEVAELGLTDAFIDAICFVEWPEKMTRCGPPDALKLDFSPGPDTDQRFVAAAAQAPRWNKVVEMLSAYDAA
jgi:tRNA threonylcarbamoyladenosine biosynthesis protein TsaE